MTSLLDTVNRVVVIAAGGGLSIDLERVDLIRSECCLKGSSIVKKKRIISRMRTEISRQQTISVLLRCSAVICVGRATC